MLEVVAEKNFPWDKIDKLFRAELRQRTLLANGESIKVDATIFDVITEVKKGNSTAIGYLDFLNRLFQELSDNLTTSEKLLANSIITNMLSKHDKGYWGYVAEVATLNNLIKSKSYLLMDCEVQLEGTKLIDFKLHNLKTNVDVFVEVLSLHWENHKINEDTNLMKAFLQGRIHKKLGDKGIDPESHANLYLAPVLWGDKNAIKKYSDFFKKNSLDIKNVLQPLSYISYSDGNGYYEHYFQTISNLFSNQ